MHKKLLSFLLFSFLFLSYCAQQGTYQKPHQSNGYGASDSLNQKQEDILREKVSQIYFGDSFSARSIKNSFQVTGVINITYPYREKFQHFLITAKIKDDNEREVRALFETRFFRRSGIALLDTVFAFMNTPLTDLNEGADKVTLLYLGSTEADFRLISDMAPSLIALASAQFSDPPTGPPVLEAAILNVSPIRTEKWTVRFKGKKPVECEVSFIAHPQGGTNFVIGLMK